MWNVVNRDEWQYQILCVDKEIALKTLDVLRTAWHVEGNTSVTDMFVPVTQYLKTGYSSAEGVLWLPKGWSWGRRVITLSNKQQGCFLLHERWKNIVYRQARKSRVIWRQVIYILVLSNRPHSGDFLTTPCIKMKFTFILNIKKREF